MVLLFGDRLVNERKKFTMEFHSFFFFLFAPPISVNSVASDHHFHMPASFLISFSGSVLFLFHCSDHLVDVFLGCSVGIPNTKNNIDWSSPTCTFFIAFSINGVSRMSLLPSLTEISNLETL